MNMLQQALQCPDGTILLPRYEWHFIQHEQKDGRWYFIDWWEMCRYWSSDDAYELLLIDENDLMPHVVDNLVLVTKYWIERFNGLSDEQLKQRHASKVFPEWIENCFKWRMWFAYRADKKYEWVTWYTTFSDLLMWEKYLGGIKEYPWWVKCPVKWYLCEDKVDLSKIYAKPWTKYSMYTWDSNIEEAITKEKDLIKECIKQVSSILWDDGKDDKNISKIRRTSLWVMLRAAKSEEDFNKIEKTVLYWQYAEKIKKVLTLYRQLDNISTSLDMFVTNVADDWFVVWINISLSPIVDELIGEDARKDVEYYLYEDMDDKYIELWCGKVYKLNTDEEFMDYMYNIYWKNELTK